MNKLEHLAEFQDILRNYRISPASQQILASTKLVLLAAPTSSGRNAIIRELIKTGEYHYIVSDTTRQPRVNDGVPERDGVEYWFRAEEEVLADLRAGKFLEAAIIHEQQVSGISLRELEKARDGGKIAVTDIEIIGTENIMAVKPDAIPLFILPPSFEEWQRRLKHRGEMSPAELKRRMESALKEFTAALEHPYYTFIVNDKISKALEQIHQKAVLGHADPLQQKVARELVEQLYVETQAFLKTLE